MYVAYVIKGVVDGVRPDTLPQGLTDYYKVMCVRFQAPRRATGLYGSKCTCP